MTALEFVRLRIKDLELSNEDARHWRALEVCLEAEGDLDNIAIRKSGAEAILREQQRLYEEANKHLADADAYLETEARERRRDHPGCNCLDCMIKSI